MTAKIEIEVIEKEDTIGLRRCIVPPESLDDMPSQWELMVARILMAEINTLIEKIDSGTA